MIEVFLFLCLLVLLNTVGFTYKNIYNKKFDIKIPEILIGFILFILLGSLISIISFQELSNATTWKISYFSLLFFSVFFILRKKLFREIFYSFLNSKNLFFSIIFILIALLRMANSDILNTEKIMEFMILSSSMSSSSIISEDLWFHNENISYYSYGYFVFSSIPLVLNMESSVAYNFILPTVISMTYLSSYRLIAYFFYSSRKKILGLTIPLIFIFIFFLGPFATILEFISHSSLGTVSLFRFIEIDGINKMESFELFWPKDNWWWFSISRIISYKRPDLFYSDYTINEFPAFSIILGDIHPHVLVLPFVILCFSLIFNMFYKKDFSIVSVFWVNLIFILTILINPWYLVVLIWYIFVNIFFNREFLDNNQIKSIRILLVSLIIQIALFIILINPNNLLAFPYIANVKIISRFHHLFMYWGFSFIPICIFLVYGIYKNQSYRKLLRFFLIILMASLLIPLIMPDFHLNLELFINLLINNLFFSFILSSTIILIKKEYGLKKNILILLFTSSVIIFGAEFIYVVDQFNNRMNTIFKFYFINYILLNLISIYIILNFIKSIDGIKKYLTIFLIGILIIPSIWWSSSAIMTRANDNIGAFNSNGLNFLTNSEDEAINFIKTNIPKDQIILEGVGKSYTRSNIITAASNRATLLGWVNHQLQWRSNPELILSLNTMIEEFYNNPTKDNELLNTYNVEYILLSTFEKKRYDLNNDSNFNDFKQVFENDNFKIFKVND
jgi:YYY domain-containing protein